MNKPDFNQPIIVEIDDIFWGNFYFRWRQSTVGFGELSISKKEGSDDVAAETEGMGPEWTRRALYAAVDALIDQMKRQE
jgi:hypothetical protein